MMEFLKGFGISLGGPMLVKADNEGAMALARNPVFHDRSKHIDIQFHFTRSLVKEGKIVVDYVPTAEMLADLLTKSLPRPRHTLLCKSIGIF